MTKPILTISDMSITFSSPDEPDIEAVRQVDRTLTPGKTLALVGESGCGKSVTARAVLLDRMTVRQNVALPLTIEIDPISESMVPQADALAVEAGIDPAWLGRPAHEAPMPVRLRIHLARALALRPQLLLLEHPTAALEAADRPAFADDVRRAADARHLTVLACSQDREFARRLAARFLQLHPGTGTLTPITLS